MKLYRCVNGPATLLLSSGKQPCSIPRESLV